MPNYQVVTTTVSGKLHLLMPLLKQHRDELEPGCEIAPEVKAYEALERGGLLLSLLLLCDDEVVGYSIGYFGPHMHYSGITCVHNDMLYVLPEHRRQGGLMLMRETERTARERGANTISWHAKPDTALEHLLPRLGYKAFETIYTKGL